MRLQVRHHRVVPVDRTLAGMVTVVVHMPVARILAERMVIVVVGVVGILVVGMVIAVVGVPVVGILVVGMVIVVVGVPVADILVAGMVIAVVDIAVGDIAVAGKATVAVVAGMVVEDTEKGSGRAGAVRRRRAGTWSRRPDRRADASWQETRTMRREEEEHTAQRQERSSSPVRHTRCLPRTPTCFADRCFVSAAIPLLCLWLCLWLWLWL
jgi:hypothetical protein